MSSATVVCRLAAITAAITTAESTAAPIANRGAKWASRFESTVLASDVLTSAGAVGLAKGNSNASRVASSARWRRPRCSQSGP